MTRMMYGTNLLKCIWNSPQALQTGKSRLSVIRTKRLQAEQEGTEEKLIFSRLPSYYAAHLSQKKYAALQPTDLSLTLMETTRKS